jgi:SNF2 family DNA or RNA helicase
MKGGILSDTMVCKPILHLVRRLHRLILRGRLGTFSEKGLGKTVQMLATCQANPSQDVNRRTTLVVAPLALLSQWEVGLF